MPRRMQTGSVRGILWALVAALLPLGPAAAQSLHRGDVLQITRATGPVRVDGELNDETWKAVQPIEQWYEVNPGDNVAPKVRSVGYLTFDDRFFTPRSSSSIPTPKPSAPPMRIATASTGTTRISAASSWTPATTATAR